MTNYFIPQTKLIYTFYKDFNNDINNVSNIDINNIIEKSKTLNNLYNSQSFKPTKLQRYIKIMEYIHSNYRENFPTNSKFSTTSILEKMLLLVFSVDPEFEAFIIYSSENTIKEIKIKMEHKFGIYDKNLIKVEKFFIQNLLDIKKQNEIYEEIDKRAFK